MAALAVLSTSATNRRCATRLPPRNSGLDFSSWKDEVLLGDSNGTKSQE